jgi:hypothetical protein
MDQQTLYLFQCVAGVTKDLLIDPSKKSTTVNTRDNFFLIPEINL